MTQRPRLPDRLAERLVRCIAGLACFGIGIAMIVDAELGLAPWDVFHQGAGDKLGLSIGWLIVITGVLLLLIWIPLHQRPGIGTILNAVEIGVVVNVVGRFLPHVEALVPRVALLVGGVVVIAVGSGLYIGAALGAGPRDGLMIGLAARGISVRLARTIIEATVLVLGLFLGGSIGVGTVAFTLGIGPLCHVTIPRLAMRPSVRPAAVGAPDASPDVQRAHP